MLFMFVTFAVLKLESTLIPLRLSQSLNIESMLVTFSVLNPARFRLVSPEQPENMEVMLVTLDVSSPVKFRLISDEQLRNNPSMLVTFDVLKFDKSRFASAVQP